MFKVQVKGKDDNSTIKRASMWSAQPPHKASPLKGDWFFPKSPACTCGAVLFPSDSISHNRDFSQVPLSAGKSRNELQCLFSVLFDNRTNGRGCDHLTEQGLLRVRIFFAKFYRLTEILRRLFSVAGTVGKNSDAKRAMSECSLRKLQTIPVYSQEERGGLWK